MRAHDKLGEADAVAVFDDQDSAEGAVLGLRLAGFADDQIGYYTRNHIGLVIDFLGRTYVGLGTLLGVVFGAAFGLWVGAVAGHDWHAWYGPVFLAPEYQGLVVCGLSGAILGG